MFRSVMLALRIRPTIRARFPTIPNRTLASKDQLPKVAIPPALADSSKMLLNALQEVFESNEVKLLRLTAVKVAEESQKLFRTYVLENQSFRDSLQKMKMQMDKMQEVAEREAKGGAAKVEKVAAAVKTAAKDTKDKIKEASKAAKKS